LGEGVTPLIEIVFLSEETPEDVLSLSFSFFPPSPVPSTTKGQSTLCRDIKRRGLHISQEEFSVGNQIQWHLDLGPSQSPKL
jgi:hypothetical protein